MTTLGELVAWACQGASLLVCLVGILRLTASYRREAEMRRPRARRWREAPPVARSPRGRPRGGHRAP